MGMEYGVSDLFKDRANLKGDSELLSAGGTFISDTFGFAISVGVYGLVLSQFLITACDLLYIAVPPVRGLLVSGEGKDKVVSGIGHFTGFDEMGDKNIVRAHQWETQGRPDLAAMCYKHAQTEQRLSNESDARRAKMNEDRVARASKRVQKTIDLKNRCFVSSDLRSLIHQNRVILSSGSVGAQNGSQKTSLNIKVYFRKRVFTMILLVVFIMMAVASNIFTKTGMNIGAGILKVFGF